MFQLWPYKAVLVLTCVILGSGYIGVTSILSGMCMQGRTLTIAYAYSPMSFRQNVWMNEAMNWIHWNYQAMTMFYSLWRMHCILRLSVSKACRSICIMLKMALYRTQQTIEPTPIYGTHGSASCT